MGVSRTKKLRKRAIYLFSFSIKSLCKPIGNEFTFSQDTVIVNSNLLRQGSLNLPVILELIKLLTKITCTT